MARTLALPLAVGPNGALASLTQGAPEEISQSVALLLDTRPGERAAVPDYGLPDSLGSGLNADQVVDVITAWEERATDPQVEDLLEKLTQDATVHSQTTGPAGSTTEGT